MYLLNNSQLINKQYKNALRQSHFVERHYISFLLWKLNVEKVSVLPSYKTWCWRSFYSRKKKSELKKRGFLLNLYLALDIWKPSKDIMLHGFINDAAKGWGLNYNDNLQKHMELNNMIKFNFVEKQKVSLTTITTDWLTLKPRNWITVKNNIMLTDEFDDFQLENYMLLDSHNHGFQFKIICNLPTILNKRCNIKMPSWYLKVLFLRGFKYPVIFHYKYIPLLANLSYFGQRQFLPWESTLEPDGVWQLDPIALKMIEIGKGLTEIYRRGEITEYLIKKRWLNLLNGTDKISILTQEALCQEPHTIMKLLQKASRILN
jgi:hypothetical protein